MYPNYHVCKYMTIQMILFNINYKLIIINNINYLWYINIFTLIILITYIETTQIDQRI